MVYRKFHVKNVLGMIGCFRRICRQGSDSGTLVFDGLKGNAGSRFGTLNDLNSLASAHF